MAGVLLLVRLQRRRFWLFFHLTFLGTLLHELAHYLVALVLNGHPRGLSVQPRREGNMLILGEVPAANMRWYNGTAIALAPLGLLGVAWLFYSTQLSQDQSWPWFAAKVFVLASLIQGAIPSSSDFRMALRFGLVPAAILVAWGVWTYLV